MGTQTAGIDLYTAGTPNGHKISIFLEELADAYGHKYTAHHVDISKNAQKEEWFLKLNPNGRIPAITDNNANPPRRIFEGGAILLYLSAKLDTSHQFSFEYDTPNYWESLEWIVWMQSGIGPMQGQANHFYRYAPEKIGYAIKRYQTECKRLYQVLEDRLAEQETQGHGLWVVGGKYSIADIACFSWVNWAEWAGVSTSPYQKVEKWMDNINKRAATQRGVNVPEEFVMKKAMQSKEGEEEFAKHHSKWVMQNQTADQEKHK